MVRKEKYRIQERVTTESKREISILLKMVERVRNYKFQSEVAQASRKVNAKTFLRRKRLILPLEMESKDIKIYSNTNGSGLMDSLSEIAMAARTMNVK